MTIQERIKAIAKDMGIAYIYHNWAAVNVEVEQSQLPVMINVLPVSGGFHLDGFQLVESCNCMVAFLDKTEFDFKAEDNDTVVGRMKTYAKDFLKRVNDSEAFETIDLSNVQYQIVYDKLDVCLTGVVLEFQLKELEGDCII